MQRDVYIILGASTIAILIGAWLFLSHPEETYAPHENGEQVLFEVLERGTYAAEVRERTNYRIRSAEELKELWRMVYGAGSHTLPAVDFTKHEVLAVFDGTHASGGYEVSVRDIDDSGLRRVVHIVRTSPGESCIITSALSSPFEILRVPKTTLLLAHENIMETKECE